MSRARLRLPIAIVAAAVCAEAAVLLLRPRTGVIPPAKVPVHDYFSRAEVERARDYGRPQLAIYGGQLLLQGGVLVFLVLRPPALLRRRFRHPILGAAAVGAGLAVTLTLVTLPLGAVARKRSLDVGLITQSWGGWAGDVAKSTGIEIVLSGAGAALLIGAMRRFGGRWWMPASAGVVGISALFLFAGPVILDPLFNKFTPLRSGALRSEVLDLAKKADVTVGQVYEVDASRRTTATNAYVTGLGHTKRVVLYDNLIKDFTSAQTRLVVAHELGHVHYHDVPRGLIFVAIVAPFSLFAAALLTERLARGRLEPGSPGVVPAAVLSIALVGMPVSMISNQLSRRIEARSDTFALDITHEPRPYIEMERKLAVQNLSDPKPPGWVTWLLGTHPPAVERIGAAVAYERGKRG